MIKPKDHGFKFLFNPNIPNDNNAYERAVRTLKVKKVSRWFSGTNEKGTDAFFANSFDYQAAKKNNQKFLLSDPCCGK